MHLRVSCLECGHICMCLCVIVWFKMCNSTAVTQVQLLAVMLPACSNEHNFQRFRRADRRDRVIVKLGTLTSPLFFCLRGGFRGLLRCYEHQACKERITFTLVTLAKSLQVLNQQLQQRRSCWCVCGLWFGLLHLGMGKNRWLHLP